MSLYERLGETAGIRTAVEDPHPLTALREEILPAGTAA
jgi:hypothetical protein